MSLEVHQALPTDAEALSTILNHAREFKLNQGDGIWGNYAFTPEEVAEAIDQGNTYLATENGQALGTFKLLWEDERMWGQAEGTDGTSGYLHRLAIAEGFHGLGRKLVDCSAEQIRARERQHIRLDCATDNMGLCSYYEKLGFTIVRRIVVPSTGIASEYPATLFQRDV